MMLHETGLVILYFFRREEIERQVAAATPTAVEQWCQFLTAQLHLEPVSGQRQVWHHPQCPISLDVQHNSTFFLVRLALQATTQDTIPHWEQLYQHIYPTHETVFSQWAFGFCGCTLIYSGIIKENDLVAVGLTTLDTIPVQESLPHPRHLNVRSGQLWQVQETIPDKRPENIYGLLVQPSQAEAIAYQLLYHPAFWQAEAIYHGFCTTWHHWEKTQRPIGAQAIQQLEMRLASFLELPHQSIPLPQLRELADYLLAVQQYETVLHLLQEQIAAAPQHYRALIDTLTTTERGDLFDYLQDSWQDHREQLTVTMNHLHALRVQVTNGLVYQQLLWLAQKNQRRLRPHWLTWGMAFVILCGSLFQQRRSSHLAQQRKNRVARDLMY